MLDSAPRSLRIFVQLLLVVVVAGAIYLYAPAIGAVSTAALQNSLAREVGGATNVKLECTERVSGVYRCPVHDPNVAGSSVTYELKRRGRRCWDAAQVVPRGNALDQTASGCVGVRDQARPDQRL